MCINGWLFRHLMETTKKHNYGDESCLIFTAIHPKELKYSHNNGGCNPLDKIRYRLSIWESSPGTGEQKNIFETIIKTLMFLLWSASIALSNEMSGRYLAKCPVSSGKPQWFIEKNMEHTNRSDSHYFTPSSLPDFLLQYYRKLPISSEGS